MISLTFYIISPTSASSIEMASENISPRSAEILNNSRSDVREAWPCMSHYERKTSVVQDTVYQQRCINVTLPHCHLTHIPATRTAVETRSGQNGSNDLVIRETTAGFEFEMKRSKLSYFI